MALNSTMNISIAVIQNLFLLFPQESIFFLKKYISHLKGLLYPCLLSPTPSRAELYLRVHDPNLIPFTSSFCSKLWKWIQKEEERQPIIGDSEYQWPRKFQQTNPYNQDQINLCDAEKTLWRLYTRSSFILVLLYTCS